MLRKRKKICIIGAGGFGREVLCIILDSIVATNLQIEDIACFMVNDENFTEHKIMGIEVIPQSAFVSYLYSCVVGIGDPTTRKRVVNSLPNETKYTTIIHPSSIISKFVKIREGSIITAGVITTCNIKIGKHAHLNLQTTIGHDCLIGDFFTTAPGTNISGNCHIGECVYFGTNSSVKEGVTICDNVIIGMGGVVVKNITEEGVYIGNPLKKLVKN